MEFEQAINFVKVRLNHECSSEISQNWEGVIECLQRGEKYEEMWGETKKYYGNGYFYYTENNKDCVTFIHRMMNGMEQRYFRPRPKSKKEKINDIMTAVRDSYAYLDRPNSSERDGIIDMLMDLRGKEEIK